MFPPRSLRVSFQHDGLGGWMEQTGGFHLGHALADGCGIRFGGLLALGGVVAGAATELLLIPGIFHGIEGGTEDALGFLVDLVERAHGCGEDGG